MKLLFIVTSLLPLIANPVDDRSLVSWVIEPSSNLIINGSSNVNQFSCGLNSYLYADTLEVEERTPTHIKFSKRRLLLPVVDFDCKNRLITNDFQETLQTDKYPQIGITFLSLKLVSAPEAPIDNYDALLLIELAGKTRQVNILFSFYEKSYSQFKLTGNKSLRFSDFELEPPTKMMGLVKVADELTIDFNLVIRPL